MPRNVSGTYSLPLPPVVPNTVIQAAWANTTTDDIAQGITDSLDRNGRGGMIAPFRLVDGSELQPAFAFASETGTGLYKVSPGIMGVSIMGAKVAQWSAASYDLLGDLNLTGNLGVTGDILFAGDILGTITITGGIAVQGGISSFDDISVTEDFDGDAGFYATNISPLTHSYAVFKATNNAGHNFGLAAVGSANVDFPANADTGVLFSDHAGGITLVSTTGTGIIRFDTGGFNERMRISALGEVGIACIPPTGIPFRVQAPGANDLGFEWERVSASAGEIRTYNRAGGAWGRLHFGASAYQWNANGTAKMFLDAAGTLTVGGAGNFGDNLIVSKASSGGDVTAYVINSAFAANSRAKVEISNGGTAVGSDAFTHYVNQGTWDWSTGIHAQTSSYRIGVSSHLASPVLTISTTTNVGIGNSSPSFKLDVQGPTSGVAGLHVDVASAPAQGMIRLGDRADIGGGGDYQGWQFIDLGATARMHLTTGGYLGLNCSPSYAIDIVDTGSGVIRMRHASGVATYLQANGNTDGRVGNLSNHPFYIVTNGALRMKVPEQSSFPIYEIQNGILYTLALDPGDTPTTVPLGGLAMGRIFGALPALQYGSSATFSAGGGVTILGAGGATVNLNYGTWRFIGRDTNATNVDCTLWIRVG